MLFDLGRRQEFSDAGANIPYRGLNQNGQDHASFIISLFQGHKHHVIFRKNYRNNWLETVCFQNWREDSIIFLH